VTGNDHNTSRSLYQNDVEFRRDTRHIRQYLEQSRTWRNLVLLLVILSPFACFTFYFSALKHRENAALQAQLLNLTRTVAASFDAARHGALVSDATTGPAYRELLTSLSAVRDGFPPIQRLYTLVLRDDGTYIVLDTDDVAVSASAVPPALLRLYPAGAGEQARWQQLRQQESWVSAAGTPPLACVRLAGSAAAGLTVLCADFVADALRISDSLLAPDSLMAIMFTALASVLLVYSVMKNHEQVTKSLQLVEKQRDLFLEYSHTDPLTGALNRRVFRSAYRVAEAQLRRNNLPFALIAIDIDHFKQINDRYGHDLGDLVLRTMVQELQKIIRPSDILMRMGGEEFSILCNLADERQALSMAEKLRETAARIELTTADGRSVKFTISLGVHIIGNADTMDTARKYADIALYHAKGGGRNRTVIYSIGLDEKPA